MIKNVLAALFGLLRDAYHSYPAVVVPAVVGTIVTVAAACDVVLDPDQVEFYAGLALAALFGGAAIQRKTQPMRDERPVVKKAVRRAKGRKKA